MNTARKIRDLLCAQGTYCTGQGGSSFSRQSDGRGWSLLLEAKSLKTTQVRSSGSSPLRLDGSCDG
jgi:hypothetical protein